MLVLSARRLLIFLPISGFAQAQSWSDNKITWIKTTPHNTMIIVRLRFLRLSPNWTCPMRGRVINFFPAQKRP